MADKRSLVDKALGIYRDKGYTHKEALDAEKNYREAQRQAQSENSARRYLKREQSIDKMKKLPTSWSGKLYDKVLKEVTDYRTPEQVAVDKIFEDL